MCHSCGATQRGTVGGMELVIAFAVVVFIAIVAAALAHDIHRDPPRCAPRSHPSDVVDAVGAHWEQLRR